MNKRKELGNDDDVDDDDKVSAGKCKAKSVH
jgi:hypothetical protein